MNLKGKLELGSQTLRRRKQTANAKSKRGETSRLACLVWLEVRVCAREQAMIRTSIGGGSTWRRAFTLEATMVSH